MKSTFLISTALLVASLVNFSYAAIIPPHSKTITLPLKRRQVTHDKLGRRAAADLSLKTNIVAFYATIEVGTPPQSFEVIIDTGSYYFWLMGTTCKNCTMPTYDHTLSSTFQATPKAFNTSYGDHHVVSGAYGLDTVSLGSISLQQQSFGIISNSNFTFKPLSAEDPVIPSGLMGLSFPNTNEGDYVPVVYDMYKQGLLDSTIFAMNLLYDNSTDAGGVLTLGGVDDTKFAGNISYVPIANATVFEKVVWMVNVQDITIIRGNISNAAKPVKFNQGGNVTVPIAMDSGTTLTTLPKNLLLPVIQSITGSQEEPPLLLDTFYQVGCQDYEDMYFRVSISHNYDGSVLDAMPLNLDIPLAGLVTKDDTTGKCFFAISTPNVNFKNEVVIFGADFLSEFYMVFDMEKRQVGYANLLDSNSVIGAQ